MSGISLWGVSSLFGCLGTAVLAIFGNIDHFDNEIDLIGVDKLEGFKFDNFKPQVDQFIFSDGHTVIALASGRLLNVGCPFGLPFFCSR
mmetsp:Transcript_56931/g.109934  ORF Transcript_56931/g.109934 Transcript_56931/m.109934 type:complete len:89 (-) Transcript_56931:9-275(-)